MLICLSPKDDPSFAIVLELQQNKAPLAARQKVGFLQFDQVYILIQGQGDPPPWIPANKQHTTEGASEHAELHFIRAVDTGVINVSSPVNVAFCFLHVSPGLSCCSRVSPKIRPDE